MNKNLKKTALLVGLTALMAGCASVPVDRSEHAEQVKTFSEPSEGLAGLYIFRSSFVGVALQKSLWVNDECIGRSANKVFFYTELAGDQTHKISTESEFTPNNLTLETEAGKNYFVEQYIKFGVFVGGANLRVVSPEQAKAKIAKLNLAKKTPCETPIPNAST